MPKPRLINPKKQFSFQASSELMLKVYAELFSDVEGRVPYGKLSEFIEQCIREHFEGRTEQTAPAPESGGATLDSTQQPAGAAADPQER